MKRAFLKNLVLSLLLLLLGLSFVACDLFTNDDVDDTPEEKTYYQINLEQTENGTVSADKQKAEAGETVTLTVSPAEGYKLTAIYLNGEALEGTSFVMPEQDVTVSAAFEKIIVYYNVTVSSTENGTVSADKQSAAAGETVVLSATPDIAYKLDYFTVNGEAIEGNRFVMPEGDVTVSARFAEIFAKGENFGYTNGFISTKGVDVSLDNGENPTTVINGSGEQYAYFNSVYSNKLYAEVKINAEKVLNNDGYPKFGFVLENGEGRIAFYVAADAGLNAGAVGRVYFDGENYVWANESLVSVSNMKFSGEDYITLAVVRDNENVYLYVNGVLVMYELNCQLLQNAESALSVFSFNTVLNLKEYSVLSGEAADAKIAEAKQDYLKFDGENYGNSGDYKTSVGVDLTYDRGENPYVIFDGEGSPQFAYLEEVKANQLYYQADFNVLSVKNGDAYPKFGLFVQTTNKTIFFYIDMKTDLTATDVGVVYVRDGAWDWGNTRTAKVNDMSFSGESTVNLAVMRDGADFVFLVNGKFALAIPASELELNESAFGVFGFNTEMNVYNTQVDESEEKIAEIKKLIPIVGPGLNGVGYYIDEYVYDPETNTITLLRAGESARTIATLYQNGSPIRADRFVIEGTVRMYNTKTSGSAASKVELQVGVDVYNFYKILIYRYETGSSANNSIYIEGANSKDNGNIWNTRVKYNTLTSGTDYTMNYKVIYDYGTIYFVIDDEVQLIYETGWNEASYSFGVTQYADTVWTGTKATVGSGVEEIVANYKDEYLAYKTASDLNKDGYIESDAQISLGSDALIRVGGTLIAGANSAGSAHSVYISNENGVVAEYRLFNDSGKWGIERIIDGKSEMLVAPMSNNAGFMNFEIARSADLAVFMLNGKVYDKLEGNFENTEILVGTSDGARLYNSYSVQLDSEETFQSYVDNAPVYTYYSRFNSRIDSLYDEYITSGNSEQGGVLIMGSSTMDFWDAWAEHMNLTDKVTGYNVGIGGTTTEDWLAAYDKLVKPFEPSCVIIFVGGNDLNVNGARPVDVADRLMKLMGMIHTDFPDADIYYIYSLPCPGYWENGHWARSDFAELTSTLKSYIDAVDYINDIDVSGVLTDENGNPVREYFRDDNIHQTELGYQVWADYLNEVIAFPENLGKWEVNSQVPVLESGFVTFGESVTLDFSDTEHAGNEGITVTVLDEDGANVAVTREGDVFTFVMPTSDVTVSYFVSEKYTNEIWIDNGVLLKGVFNSKSLNKESGLTVKEHFANQSLAECLPEIIASNTYLYGYAVSSDGGASFGEITTDASQVMLLEGDILKVCFAMMGTAASGNSMFSNRVELDALNNTVSLGYDGNTGSTRYWGALYQNGEIYMGNNYTVSMTVTIDKLADQNGVIEIQVSNMPATNVFRGEKMYFRWEKNTTLLKYQETTNPASAYSYSWTKTNTDITVADTTDTSITMNVVINVTPEGFTMTVTNAEDATQTFTETYVFSDETYNWYDVNICIASVQSSKLTVSDIKFEENN